MFQPIAYRCTRSIALAGLLGLLFLCGSRVGAAELPLDVPELSPTYLSQRMFMLPYQLNASDPLAREVDKVRLLMSRGSGSWKTLQEANSNVRGFTYHCPDDGQYYFAVQMVDRRGNAWPSGVIKPQVRLIVDTSRPEIELQAKRDSQGRVLIRYAARDANLAAATMRLELQADYGPWQTARLPKADVTQPDRLMGRFLWRAPADAGRLRIRAGIQDTSKLLGTANLQLLSKESAQPAAPQPLRRRPYDSPADSGDPAESPQGEDAWQLPDEDFPDTREPLPAGPRFESPGDSVATNAFPDLEWPADNAAQPYRPLPPVRVPASRDHRAAERRRGMTAPGTPPFSNTYTKREGRTQAKLVNDGRRNDRPEYSAHRSLANRSERESTDFQQQPHSRDSWDAPPRSSERSTGSARLLPRAGRFEAVGSHVHDHRESGDHFDSYPADADRMLVNSRTFDVEYDLETVGRWGVAKVEIWGTRDGGRTWRSYAEDTDNRSPIRVTVPSAGTFGLRILVDGANGAASPAPEAGDTPELVVKIDLNAPTAELISAEIGSGPLADNLLIQWAAADTNLERRPIGLFYSAYADGPWSTVATGIENTGQYAWRIERHVPERFFLKIEARDTAGNVTAVQTPTPVALNRPQPAGRLRGVRSISNRSNSPRSNSSYRDSDRHASPQPSRGRSEARPREPRQTEPRIRHSRDQTAMESSRGQR